MLTSELGALFDTVGSVVRCDDGSDRTSTS